MIRALTTSAYYQGLIFLRLKQAMFFTLVFPAFLFVVFGFIWGTPGDTYYYTFLLTGVACATALSDGLFAIGPVVREFYNNGFIRYVRQLPLPGGHVIGLFLSRYVVLLAVTILLALLAWVCFGLPVEVAALGRLIAAVAIGFTAFSIIGLAVSFLGDRLNGGKGLGNLLYFVIIFTSPAFYPVDLINPTVAAIGDLFPLTPVLRFARAEPANWWPFVAWVAVCLPVFWYTLRHRQITR